ncbi:MAG TPA: hypothetical protein VFV37_11445 [Luteibaculaceae bacterium]|jgi:hypothetical protein|nr:hypothetical protein [Luteibaculaceae bacterium]
MPTFPQFKKYADGSSYFAVMGPKHLIELKAIGTKWIRLEKMATVYPDVLFISDLLTGDNAWVEPLTASEEHWLRKELDLI